MAVAYIGLGSNIEPERNVLKALRLLANDVQVVDLSTFYRTRPLTGLQQSDFINGVACIKTGLAPADLKNRVLRGIEAQLGRTPQSDKYAARSIDLDLLLYADRVLAAEGIVLPHPDIFTRAFVAKPLFELAPELVLPGSGESIRKIADRLSTAGMEPLPEFTRELEMQVSGNRVSLPRSSPVWAS